MKTFRRIQLENISSIQVEMSGQEFCALGTVILNGIKVNESVKSVELVLRSNKNPSVLIEVNENLVKDSTKESWGIASPTKGTNIFAGLTFPHPPIPKEDFINLYDDYVRSASGS